MWMSSMKKFLFGLFALCLLAIVGGLFILPYGLGFVAENKYKQIVDVLAKSNNAMQITLMDYQRGWFSSEATLKLELPKNLNAENISLVPSETLSLILKQHIEHGPVFSLASNNS